MYVTYRELTIDPSYDSSADPITVRQLVNASTDESAATAAIPKRRDRAKLIRRQVVFQTEVPLDEADLLPGQDAFKVGEVYLVFRP